MSNQIMCDLETMGQKSNSAIIALGAVRFDKTGILDEFYRVITLASSVEAGLKTDPETVMWWMKQSDDARAQFNNDDAVSLKLALLDFKEWCEIKVEGNESNPTISRREEMCLWGNGSDFDNVVLSHAYEKTNLKQPWLYFNNRCYRTLKNMHPSIKAPTLGVYHNALDDAKNQALHLIDILKFNTGLVAA